MRALIAFSLVFLATACDPQPLPSRTASAIAVEPPPDATPHVVRRLIGEAQEQVEKDRQMAAELPDPSGRERAQAQVREVASELAELAARVDDANSDNLDDLMRRLSALNPRIDDLHDALRGATGD